MIFDIKNVFFYIKKKEIHNIKKTLKNSKPVPHILSDLKLMPGRIFQYFV